MKTKEILVHFGAILANGNCVLIDAVESTTKPGKYNYTFAQLRKRAIANPALAAIASIRSAEFADNVAQAWVSSISAESHNANIASGVVTYDAQGDFVATECPQFKVVFNESKGVTARNLYESEDEITFSDSRVKRRSADGPILCADGIPIMRESTIADAGTPDVLVASNSTMDDDAYEAWKQAFLASAECSTMFAEAQTA